MTACLRLVLALGLVGLMPAADTLAIQRAGLAFLARKFAGQEPTVSCVWATPPAGKVDGQRARDADIDFREPVAEFLEPVSAAPAMRLVSGPACEGGLQGVREVASGLPSRWFFIEAPTRTDGTATLIVGYYCGGKCAGRYALSLAYKDRAWTVVKDDLLEIS